MCVDSSRANSPPVGCGGPRGGTALAARGTLGLALGTLVWWGGVVWFGLVCVGGWGR